MLKKIWEKICGIGRWIKRNAKALAATIAVYLMAQLVPTPVNEVSFEKLQQKYEQSAMINTEYQLDGNSLKTTSQDNPKDIIRIEVGNKDDTEFTPSLKISRWDEVSLKLIPNLEGVATKDKNLIFEGDRIKFETPKVDYELYNYEEGEGGYKMVWYLKEKPATNKVEFTIQSKGLDFFYQPPLTEEFQNGYSEMFKKEIVVTETQVKDLDGNVLVERPENMVGSYVFYHQTKGGMNDINGKDYKTGQGGIMYRPHITDAVGKETWGIYHLDIENETYAVEIPQDFLDKAVYPIKSNETFGYTSDGTAGIFFENFIYGSQFTINENGTGISMTAWTDLSNVALDFKMCVYDNGDGDTDATTNPLANGETSEHNTVATGTIERSANFVSAPSFTSGTTYRLYAWCKSAAGTGNLRYSSATGIIMWNTSETYGAWPVETFSKFDNIRASIYATYTPSAPPAAEVESIQSPIKFE